MSKTSQLPVICAVTRVIFEVVGMRSLCVGSGRDEDSLLFACHSF